MKFLIPPPSVGSLIKKLSTTYPNLSAQELIRIIQNSIEKQGETAGDFASAEIVNEEKAFQLAKVATFARKTSRSK